MLAAGVLCVVLAVTFDVLPGGAPSAVPTRRGPGEPGRQQEGNRVISSLLEWYADPAQLAG